MTVPERNVSASIDPVKLDRLAEVAVKVGLQLKAGQDLLVTAPTVALPLVRKIAEHAYRAGAGLVTPILSDEAVTLSRYRFAPDDSFDRAAGWLYEGMSKAFAGNTARLAIVGDNPMLLAGEDPAKVSRASKANSIAYQPALESRAPAKPIRSRINRRWKGSSISTSTGTSSPIRACPGRSRFFRTTKRMSRWQSLPTRSSLPRGSIMMNPSRRGTSTMPCCAAGPNG